MKLPYCLLKWLYYFTFPPGMYKRFSCSTSLQHLNFFSLLNFRQYSRCVVVSHFGFSLHSRMTNDVEHLFICLYAICISIWWSECSDLLPIFYWVVYKNFLHILDASPLLGTCFQIFSPSLWLAFSFFTVSFEEQMFYICFFFLDCVFCFPISEIFA